MDELFKGRRISIAEIIVLCVRWYLRYKLSFRDLVEMMAERGTLPGAHDDHALDSTLCARIRETLGTASLGQLDGPMARRRDLRQNQRTLDLALPCRQSKEGRDRRLPVARQAWTCAAANSLLSGLLFSGVQGRLPLKITLDGSFRASTSPRPRRPWDEHPEEINARSDRQSI